jgi:hypothetical protein
VDSGPKAEPQEQRVLPLYTLASRLQKQKARSNLYIVIFKFIGCFILVLHDFPLPGATWSSSCSDFSGFGSLLCHHYLPATFSGPSPWLFFSDPPPCYISRILGIIRLGISSQSLKAYVESLFSSKKEPETDPSPFNIQGL